MTRLDAGATVGAVLQRADGVQLIGEMAGSGYRVPPSLARRADGQTIQLTPLLYAVLREVNGRRTAGEVAAVVSRTVGRRVTEDNVDQLIESQLRPLGLLARSDGTQPELRKQNPLLGLRFRYALTDPERTRRVTDPFRVLFRPLMVVPLLAGFVAVCWWVFFKKGLASATYEAFERPGLLILVFVVTVLSAGFHEFGHAAAARYGGATPGVMGFGMYLVWPAFYTDVTDSYRLGRTGRIRTDLGGLYFNAIVAVAITGVWWWLQYDALLLVVATQILQMIRQLTPLVRFDGYHVLADITGVPDLYARIKPTLLGALPWRWGDPEARLLKTWARVVVTLWVVLVVPLLLGALVMMVLLLPRLVGTAWASLQKQQDVFTLAWADGDLIQAVARVLAMVAIVLPIAGIIYLLGRLARQSAKGAWRATTGKPVKRALVVLAGTLVLGGVAYAWWPHAENYRPVQPHERGTVADAVFMTGLPQVMGYAQRPAVPMLAEGQQGVMTAVWDTAAPTPTQAEPKLALVLVPKGSTTTHDGSANRTTDQGWVFPFDKPLSPGPGDNQALAVNTTDGTVEYDVAFALVWVPDGSDATNRNEAQAYASCRSCAAVAVAFQVVFVVDTDDTDDNVAIPQNLAGALNYNCINCLTYALAQQLFVTLDRPLSAGAVAALEQLWSEIADYGRRIAAGQVPLEEIPVRLEGYKNEILAIIETDQPGTVLAPTGSQSEAASPSGPASATDTASPSATNPAFGTTPLSPDASFDPGPGTTTGESSTSQSTSTDAGTANDSSGGSQAPSTSPTASDTQSQAPTPEATATPSPTG